MAKVTSSILYRLPTPSSLSMLILFPSTLKQCILKLTTTLRYDPLLGTTSLFYEAHPLFSMGSSQPKPSTSLHGPWKSMEKVIHINVLIDICQVKPACHCPKCIKSLVKYQPPPPAVSWINQIQEFFCSATDPIVGGSPA